MAIMTDTVQDIEKAKEKKDSVLAKKCATTGMVGSLGATIFSGIGTGKVAHIIHPWVGLAFVGFTIWHTYLNAKEK